MTGRLRSDVAVVLAAHGDRAGALPNQSLLDRCAALRASGLFRAVHAGVLKGEPLLEAALSDAASSGAAEIVLFPMFMAAGYFTETVLPARVAGAQIRVRCRQLAPLGLHPRLPGLMLAEATACAARAGFRLEETALLVAGHGSQQGSASAEATRAVARRLGALGSFARADIGLLEEPPFLEDQLRAAAGPVVVAGFFSGDGLHAGEDVPAAIAASGARGVYAGAVGRLPSIADLISEAVIAALTGN